MAHPEQKFFISSIKNFLPEFFRNKKVLEIGSLNINGSIRQFFDQCEYTGIDVSEGKDVDRVIKGEDMDGNAESYDAIATCEMMEHNQKWEATWLNMIRLMKPDGLIIMTCASLGRRQHGTSKYEPLSSPLTTSQGLEYYKNLQSTDFEDLLKLDHWFSSYKFFNDHVSRDLNFIGLGKSAKNEFIEISKILIQELEKYYHAKNTFGEY